MVETPASRDMAVPIPPSVRIRELTMSAQMAFHAIYTAAELGLADGLADGPQDPETLAKGLGLHGPSLYRLLRALTVTGVVKEGPNHLFALTPVGEALRRDVPGSMRAYVRFVGSPWRLASWQELAFSMRTGEPAFPKVFGMPMFDYLGAHPEHAAIFDGAMTSVTTIVEAAIVGAYDFSTIRMLVDVGGGHGRLLSGILRRNPALRGMLFDLPHVVEGAKTSFAAQGLSDRVEVRSGNFFESVPAGGDTYLMKLILHDWDDERCVRLLRNSREAMGPEGRLLVVEGVVSPPGEAALHKLLDLEMLVMLGGRERTAEEFRALFEAAGFRLARVIPTESTLKILEGVPA